MKEGDGFEVLEASWGWSVETGCPPSTGEGSEQGAVPFFIFFSFWFKMGHFLFKKF